MNDSPVSRAAAQLDYLVGTFLVEAQTMIDKDQDPFGKFKELATGVLAQFPELEEAHRDGLRVSAKEDLTARLTLLAKLRRPDGIELIVHDIIVAEAFRQANLDAMSIVRDALGETKSEDEVPGHRASYLATKADRYRQCWYRAFMDYDLKVQARYARGLIRYARSRLRGTVVL